MSKYLIKISYKDEGFSNWKNEKNPIPLYDDEKSAYQQACAIYCREVDLNSLDPALANTIKNLIIMQNYQQAVLEMNFSNTMRFIINKTVDKTPDSILLKNFQFSLNYNQNTNNFGAVCRKCNHQNQYATPDNSDGKYTCYACKP